MLLNRETNQVKGNLLFEKIETVINEKTRQLKRRKSYCYVHFGEISTLEQFF